MKFVLIRLLGYHCSAVVICRVQPTSDPLQARKASPLCRHSTCQLDRRSREADKNSRIPIPISSLAWSRHVASSRRWVPSSFTTHLDRRSTLLHLARCARPCTICTPLCHNNCLWQHAIVAISAKSDSTSIGFSTYKASSFFCCDHCSLRSTDSDQHSRWRGVITFFLHSGDVLLMNAKVQSVCGHIPD
jgi:hypothetical protein